ncbi:helix-turn-helix domain-containing protein [Mycobacteroides chelonae]|uniref:helix-turn-helix domain-containing protein n=1 Tax=Mycobacteroides chelonae TaxID=1774 RepID=UPI00099289F0|nr:helix-turn-helix domain-containing protein [Mycobacteroides chelonae]
MTSREPFQHAVQNASVRRDIAAAVRDGIPAEQLAEEFSISLSTVRAYVAGWEGVQRKIQCLNEFEREAIIEGCARGARRRWERTYGAEIVRQVLGEA